jgi:hypothetical protein
VTYEEIMGWFCQGFGFGEIDLAYGLSQETSIPVAEIFALRQQGLGWGEIKRHVRRTPTPTLTATLIISATPTATVTLTATPTITPTLPLTLTLTATPTPTPTATTTPVVTQETRCDKEDHPKGHDLAVQYGVPYEEIMGWFCLGFGFGEIDLAYSLSIQSGVPVDQIFAMKQSGMGWGEIKKQLGPKPPKAPKNKP